MDWKHLLAYITGTVDQELLLRNEYLVTENRMLRNQITGRVRLTDGERKTLAEIGQKLGKQALQEVATIVKPDTILGWHRKLVAQKFDGSKHCKAPGRPMIDHELEALVVRMARENRSWGYDRIVGALANLGYTLSAQSVGNILKRHGLPPAPERKTTTTWQEFIRTHMEVLVATDFFTAEVWTLGGLVTYYILFFLHLGSRKIHVAGVTPHPNEAWMVQVARNVTMEEWGFLSPGQYLIHDRDGKYCPAFQQIIDAAGITRAPLPPRSPNLNAYAERWIRSVKEECLSRLILFGEASLRHALAQYVAHYHHERNHQGKGNVLLFPLSSQGREEGRMRCRERLGGLLKYYYCDAAPRRPGDAGVQSLHGCLCLADDVGGRMHWSSPQGEKTIETTGVWLFGGLTVLFALGKVMGLWGWSWGRVALPMLIFLVFNALYIATGLLYLSVFPVPERPAAEETALLRTHTDTAHYWAGLVLCAGFVFNVVSRLEQAEASTGWWLCSGRVEVLIAFGTCSVISLWLYWSRIGSLLHQVEDSHF